jgi:hypothetical protein
VFRIEIHKPLEQLTKYQGKKYERKKWLRLMEGGPCPEGNEGSS